MVKTDGAAKAHAIARKAIVEAVPEDVGLLTYGRYKLKRDGRGVTQTVEKLEEDDGR